MPDGVSREPSSPQDWTFSDPRQVLQSRRVRQSHRRRRARRIVLALLMLPMVLTLLSIVAVALLRWVPPPTTSFALQWRIVHARVPDKHWVAWSAISPEIALAVVAAEDQRFALHNGFDLQAIGDAVEERRKRGRVRGASTISQQVAKNLFLWADRSWLRKGLEAWFTVWIELLWPKRRILETYLNVAEFGDGVFGVEAAARAYFNEPAARLDRAQAALLAAVLPDPELLSAARPSGYVRARQSWIMSQMSQLGGSAYLAQLDA